LIRPKIIALVQVVQFFSQRVQEKWNKIPAAMKMAPTAKAFRNAYAKYRLTGAPAQMEE
jgi:hypothetical protein